MKKYTIEFIGTFFLLLVILFTGNPIAIGVCLTALVYMGGYISGANYNPAITLGLFLSQKIKKGVAFRYMLTQFIASFCSAAFFNIVNQGNIAPQIGAKVTIPIALLIEIVFTFLLVTVVLHTAATEKTKGNNYYGIAIGFTLMTAAFIGGPISGGAFNPAVGFGPIMFDYQNIAAHFPSLLIYFIGPFSGAILASKIYMIK